MAEKETDNLMELPPEMKKRLQDLEKDFKISDHSIEVMKELGLDTKVLEDRLAWAKKARDIMLREFK